MATDCRVFSTTFAKKTTEMTKSSNACQSFRIIAKALKLSGIIIRFIYISKKLIYIWVGLPDFRERQVENLG